MLSRPWPSNSPELSAARAAWPSRMRCNNSSGSSRPCSARNCSLTASATPATNRQIAEEVFLTVDAVKAHLRVLFERYGLSQLPQNEKRTRLVASVLDSAVLVPRDF